MQRQPPLVNTQQKQHEFVSAITRYESVRIYGWINRLVSYGNISLQGVLLGLAWTAKLSVVWHVLLLFVAYVIADFVNGLVHLYMDHRDDYTSAVGPFVAAFHLHHDTPRYRDRALWRLYIDESGSKNWLLIASVVFLTLYAVQFLPSAWLVFFAYFAVWSSLAEVSHYLCHNADTPLIRWLQRYWLILPKAHHMQHHRMDNINYAFLNGMSDGVINWIACRFYSGYMTSTDQHLGLYQAQKQHLNLEK